MNLAPIDWIIIAAYLAASLGIGIAGRRYIGSTTHFLIAGRELGPWFGIASLAATEIVTVTFMYNSEHSFSDPVFAVLSLQGCSPRPCPSTAPTCSGGAP